MAKNVVKLNNGFMIPSIGLGTWKSEKEVVSRAVQCAIFNGYRHIDCASDYENETEVGLGINAMMSSGFIKREDIFVTTKLWNTFHHPKDVQHALENSLALMKCGYIDLYLMHFPTGEDKSCSDFPNLSPEERCVSEVDYVQTWKAMESLLESKLVKSIGVSNFNIFQLNRLLCECRVIPAVNQIENHPFLTDDELVKFCQSKHIHVTAYSPLGSLDREWAQPDDPNLLRNSKLIKIAKHYNKTVAQLVLRFQLQRGLSVIPKSVNDLHIIENLDIFDFQIKSNDMIEIHLLNKNWRALDTSWIKNHKFYPFCDNYIEM